LIYKVNLGKRSQVGTGETTRSRLRAIASQISMSTQVSRPDPRRELEALIESLSPVPRSRGDHLAMLPAMTPAIAAAGPRVEFDLERAQL
jgi:hypothetical protein